MSVVWLFTNGLSVKCMVWKVEEFKISFFSTFLLYLSHTTSHCWLLCLLVQNRLQSFWSLITLNLSTWNRFFKTIAYLCNHCKSAEKMETTETLGNHREKFAIGKRQMLLCRLVKYEPNTKFFKLSWNSGTLNWFSV